MAGVHAPDHVLPAKSFLIGCHKAPKGRPSVDQDIGSSLSLRAIIISLVTVHEVLGHFRPCQARARSCKAKLCIALGVIAYLLGAPWRRQRIRTPGQDRRPAPMSPWGWECIALLHAKGLQCCRMATAPVWRSASIFYHSKPRTQMASTT